MKTTYHYEEETQGLNRQLPWLEELIMVVWIELREKQVNLLGFCCFLVLQEYHSQMRMKALPQC